MFQPQQTLSLPTELPTEKFNEKFVQNFTSDPCSSDPCSSDPWRLIEEVEKRERKGVEHSEVKQQVEPVSSGPISRF